MTGVTLQLTDAQASVLRQFAVGHGLDQRYERNLVRRGMLESARSTHGPGYYRITQLGLDALAEHDDANAITSDELWPRDADHRYRLYFLQGQELGVARAAAPDIAGLGQALQTWHEEGDTPAERGLVGILDAVEGKWVVKPWAARDSYEVVPRSTEGGTT
jgi:hypothetical protein